jgi:hypothetical protein
MANLVCSLSEMGDMSSNIWFLPRSASIYGPTRTVVDVLNLYRLGEVGSIKKIMMGDVFENSVFAL